MLVIDRRLTRSVTKQTRKLRSDSKTHEFEIPEKTALSDPKLDAPEVELVRKVKDVVPCVVQRIALNRGSTLDNDKPIPANLKIMSCIVKIRNENARVH